LSEKEKKSWLKISRLIINRVKSLNKVLAGEIRGSQGEKEGWLKHLITFKKE